MFTAQHLVDLPVVFEGMPPEQIAICNTFNNAVRDMTWDGREPSPMVIDHALQMTFDTHRHLSPHEVMAKLISGGFGAPMSHLPEGLKRYAYDTDEIKMQAALAFDRVRSVFQPELAVATPKYNRDLNTCRPGR